MKKYIVAYNDDSIEITMFVTLAESKLGACANFLINKGWEVGDISGYKSIEDLLIGEGIGDISMGVMEVGIIVS